MFVSKKCRQRRERIAALKIVQMAWYLKRSKARKDFLFFMKKGMGMNQAKRKTSQNFNPESSFFSPKRRKARKRKRKIIILLCYSKHVKISSHYVLNAPCAYYAFLISTNGVREHLKMSKTFSIRLY
ncbi:CLUMA_CG019321, isoform A [Clunio marinus]|uniref:CLUMA_CG019321, isoform A n=1 Tax=Clunio marinus TaxID=568069 RepID=A0A1J1J1C8_9DIPT|nr:CLUMA_CG019321, isoform A [Clunio marinus]